MLYVMDRIYFRWYFMDSREKKMYSLIQGKKVLDLGVGDTSDRFLHKFIAEHATSCVGVELDPKRAESLRKKGYTIVCGNAEEISLGEKFDVIIAGDLIEHVNNAGRFLETVKKHLKEDGVFYFNTPNAYSINFVLRGIFQFGKVAQFEEHVALYTEDLIRELLRRHGLDIRSVSYFSHKNNNLGSFTIRFFSFFSKYWHENMGFEVVFKSGSLQ